MGLSYSAQAALCVSARDRLPPFHCKGHLKNRTHCKLGHPLSGENVMITSAIFFSYIRRRKFEGDEACTLFWNWATAGRLIPGLGGNAHETDA
jgi:hypothetical protein